MAREEQAKRRKVTGSLSGPDTPAAVVANVGAAATTGTTGTPVGEQGEGGQADLSSEDLAKRNAEIAAWKERKKQAAEERHNSLKNCAKLSVLHLSSAA